MRRPPGPPVYGPGDQFFASSGIAGYQNRGVNGSDLGYPRKHRLQGRRSSDDLLKHRRTIDLLSQCQIFVSHSLFGPLAVLDINPCGVPANDPVPFISERVVVNEKPPILSVPATASLFLLERKTTRKRLLPFLAYFLQVFRMKHTRAVVGRHHL